MFCLGTIFVMPCLQYRLNKVIKFDTNSEKFVATTLIALLLLVNAVGDVMPVLSAVCCGALNNMVTVFILEALCVSLLHMSYQLHEKECQARLQPLIN